MPGRIIPAGRTSGVGAFSGASAGSGVSGGFSLSGKRMSATLDGRRIPLTVEAVRKAQRERTRRATRQTAPHCE